MTEDADARLIEAVARAICAADGMDPDMPATRFMGESCSLWNHCEDEARAAIAAVRAHDAGATATQETE